MSRKWKFSVYRITCLESGGVYVGVTKGTVKSRWSGHVWRALNGGEFYFSRAIRKYGPEAFDVQEICRCLTGADALSIERRLVLEHKASGDHLYNMTDGGEGAWNPAPETREKIAKGQRGRYTSPETRQKMSEAAKKRVMTPETRQKIADGHRGLKRSPETRAKMSASITKALADPAIRAKISAKVKGKKHTDETKAKVAAGVRKYMEKSEARAHLAEKTRQFMRDPEARKHLSDVIKGSKHTEEAKRKISASNKKRWAEFKLRALSQEESH